MTDSTTRWTPVWALCITQTISWGTLYYTFSVVMGPLGAARGWNQASMTGAFSVALLLTALTAYPAGKWIYRYGGRVVMSAGSLLGAAAMLLVACGRSLPAFYLGWALAGVAMSLTLYDAAFASIAPIYREEYRRAVTIITLAGGLASTIFWPLTERLMQWTDWQTVLLLYAGLHLFVCLPLHFRGLPAVQSPAAEPAQRPRLRQLIRDRRYLLFAACLTSNALVFAIVSVHLIPLLQSKGATLQQAAWLAASAGPMQVLGRLAEYVSGGRWRAMQTGLAAMAILIPALLGLIIPGAPFGLQLLCIGLYGISNGVMTIVRSVGIVELFGREHFAAVSGAIGAPTTIARAAGPFLGSVLFLRFSGYSAVLIFLTALALLSLGLFLQAGRSAATVSAPAE